VDIAAATGRARPLSRNRARIRSFVVGAALASAPAAVASDGGFLQATYFGGGGQEQARKCVYEGASGDIICVGGTTAGRVPGTAGGAQPNPAGLGDGWVARLSGDLTTVRQATYIGGSNPDGAHAIAVDPVSGDIIVAGMTSSSNLPGTAAGAQTQSGGDTDVFVARFSSDLRTLRVATYLGGSGSELSNVLGVAIEPGSGSILLAGATSSTNFPGTQGGAFGTASGSFVARLSGDLSTLGQASYVNTVPTLITDLLVHPITGDIIVAGRSSYPAGRQTGLIMAFAPDLRSMHAKLDIGDVGYTVVWALVFDPTSGDLIAAGDVNSSLGAASADGAQPNYGGGGDAFVARVSGDLSTVRRATYLGGSGIEQGFGVALHATGDIFLAGATYGAMLPGVAGGAQSERRGATDAYVARFTGDLTLLRQSTLAGGAREDNGYWLDASESGELLLSGYTESADFPATAGGAQSMIDSGISGHTAGFALRLDAGLTGGPATPTPTPTAPPATATTTPSTPVGVCVGDCNGNREVAVNELITGVNIALDQAPLSACPSFDASGDGGVAVNELISAVSNALNGCG
jgi:hypothetical protein